MQTDGTMAYKKNFKICGKLIYESLLLVEPSINNNRRLFELFICPKHLRNASKNKTVIEFGKNY